MADQKGDLDASEPATAFKLDKAHERGSIYRSADLTFAMVLCVCVACVYGLGMRVVDGVGLMIRHGLSFAARDEMTQAAALRYFGTLAVQTTTVLGAVLFAVWVTAFMVGALQARGVLLLMDSLTRFAMARREIGLAVGEPPTARGYTPSVFSELPRLCERSGPGTGAGSITGIYTVLVDGDDMNEPVSDTLRATLDGHIVLSRDIANSGQFPAVDVLQSMSRLHTAIGKPADLAAARRLLAACALYERNRQLIEIGAYKSGVSESLDRAVQLMPKIRGFLSQSLGQSTSRADSLAQLGKLASLLGVDNDGT